MSPSVAAPVVIQPTSCPAGQRKRCGTAVRSFVFMLQVNGAVGSSSRNPKGSALNRRIGRGWPFLPLLWRLTLPVPIPILQPTGYGTVTQA